MNKANISSKRFPVTLISWRAGAMNTAMRDAMNPADGVECVQNVDLTLPIAVHLPLIPRRKLPYAGKMRRLNWLERMGMPRDQRPTQMGTLGHQVKGLWVAWPSADEKILTFHSPTGCTRRRDTATDLPVRASD